MTAALLFIILVTQGPVTAKDATDIPLTAWGGKKSADYDNRVFALHATLNGGPMLYLGVDSSIGTFVLSESSASKCGISLGASVPLDWVGGKKVLGRWFREAKLTAGGFIGAVAYGLVVPDDALASYRPLDGLLGISFLQNYMWTVDPKRLVLVLAPLDSSMPMRAGTTVPFTLDQSEGIQFTWDFSPRARTRWISFGLRMLWP